MPQSPECINMHHFEGGKYKIFFWGGSCATSPDTPQLGRGIPLTPVSASIQGHLNLPPNPKTTFLAMGLTVAHQHIYKLEGAQRVHISTK